jgi:N-acetyl-gamma-glutamylphosphate reductase
MEWKTQNCGAGSDRIFRVGADADSSASSASGKAGAAEAGVRQRRRVRFGRCFPVLYGNGGYPLHPLSWPALKQQGVELLFLATPHEARARWCQKRWRTGLRVIDLSGAWRLKQEQHRAIYNFEDADAAHGSGS